MARQTYDGEQATYEIRENSLGWFAYRIVRGQWTSLMGRRSLISRYQAEQAVAADKAKRQGEMATTTTARAVAEVGLIAAAAAHRATVAGLEAATRRAGAAILALETPEDEDDEAAMEAWALACVRAEDEAGIGAARAALLAAEDALIAVGREVALACARPGTARHATLVELFEKAPRLVRPRQRLVDICLDLADARVAGR